MVVGAASIILAALLQAAVAGPVLSKERVRVTPATCREEAAKAPDDILVCAASHETYRLRKTPERYEADSALLRKAETSIFGGKGKLSAEGEISDNPAAPR